MKIHIAPSPKVLEAIKASVKESLRLYPDPESMNLKRLRFTTIMV